MRHLNSWEIAPRKGGSKSESTSTSTSRTAINKDFQPIVNQGLHDLKSMYDSGKLGEVADVSDIQQVVFDRAEDSLDKGMDVMDLARSTYQDAMDGTGLFNPVEIDEMERAAIDQAQLEFGLNNDEIAKSGLLGSSRATIMAGDQEAQMANALAKLKYDQKNLVQERAMWGP